MNKFTSAQIDEAIREDQQKAADKLTELQELQKQDNELVDQLKQEYFKAITDGDNASIDAVNEKLKEASQRIQNHNLLIEALSVKGSPSVQRIVSEAVTVWDDEMKELDQQASKLHGELLMHHKAVVEGLVLLQQMREKASGRRTMIERYAVMLSEESKAAVAYPSSFAKVDIVKYMQPLLITQYVKK